MPQERTTELLMRLLRCAVFGQELPQGFSVSPDEWDAVRRLAAKHDLLHLVEYAVRTNAAEPCFGSQAMDDAVFRYLQQDNAIESLKAAFEAEKLSFMLLKGSALRSRYPERWMRTCLDIDILIRREQLSSAVGLLTERFGYRTDSESPHEVSLFSPEGLRVELHHTLIMPENLPRTANVLASVWENASPLCGGSEYQMTLPHFYLYHIAHMAKHLRSGGCGIRFFLDLYLITLLPDYDAAACHTMAAQCGLLPFADAAEALARSWFSGTESRSPSPLEQYVLSGGTFGNTDHAVAAIQSRRSGWAGYLLHRLFPPYRRLRFEYPILKKHALLLPLIWLRRWFALLDPARRKKARDELLLSRETSPSDIASYAGLMKTLGLNEAFSNT